MKRCKLLILIVACLLLPIVAFGYNSSAHRAVTQKAFDVLNTINSSFYGNFAGFTGFCPEVRAMRASRPAGLSPIGLVIDESPAVDAYVDLEIVDVEGGFGSGGRDNPHEDEWDAIDDDARTSYEGFNYTAFNHFIDIKKGPGIFDDYDGYAYNKGSASKEQYMTASEAASGFWMELMADITGMKVDEGIHWWYNDEYVHAPGQSWYKNCSVSVERYSFPGDKGIYPSVSEECKARFPVANSTGSTNMGVPYSVFMPVDNMARYWYGRFNATKDAICLGGVMHAIQDASIPHHAAGYNGNWHQKYEDQVNGDVNSWVADPAFANDVKAMVNSWNRIDPAPPTSLAVGDWAKTPAYNWSIDKLVTWVALNAYKDYSGVYNQFKSGYSYNSASARKLTVVATAMSALALEKASAPAGWTPQEITIVGVLQPAVLPLVEDCVSFNPQTAEVKQTGESWKIMDGMHVLLDFPNQQEADRALSIIKNYGMTSMCFVGRPNPSMVYFLTNGSAPAGPAMESEDCVPFNPTQATVLNAGGSWKVDDAGHSVLDFGSNEAEARIALRVIQKHGFNQICFVGRPNASMTYFKGPGLQRIRPPKPRIDPRIRIPKDVAPIIKKAN